MIRSPFMLNSPSAPRNVVLDDEAHAVLTDFGLSKEGVDALYGTKRLGFGGEKWGCFIHFISRNICRTMGTEVNQPWFFVIGKQGHIGISSRECSWKLKFYNQTHMYDVMAGTGKACIDTSISGFTIHMLLRSPSIRMNIKHPPWCLSLLIPF